MQIQHMGSGVSITAADIEAINRLLAQLSERAPRVSIDDVLDVAANAELFLLRDDAYTLRGMATLAICCKLMGREGLVEDVVVDEAFRGQGGGALLMRALIDHARELGLKSLLLTSSPRRASARRLYASLGFSQYDTNVFGMRL
ncbi:MAG: GNAT family N-acetyltransferase [Patescibacteria group bacterium]|jgi:GNAT superfamily N-acetyltransferase